jgi:tetratricopeptide (TPR) repeat protein
MLPRSAVRPLLCVVVACALLPAYGCGDATARKSMHLERGLNFLAAENFDKARLEFQNVLQIDPRDPKARYEMGVLAERSGKMRQAAQYYQGTIEVKPDDIDARFRLGRMYLFGGAPERTLEVIKPALATHPDEPGLLTLRAAVRSQQKDVSGALADAGRAAGLAPVNEDAVAVLAGIYTSQGDTTKAQAVLEQGIQRIPASIDLRLALAQTDAQNHRLGEAEGLLLKIVAMKPDDPAHRLRLAQFYARTDQIDAAESCLRRAIKELPAEDTLKVSLVNFLAARRSRAQAEAELKGMITAAPLDSELGFALAKFYQDGHDEAHAAAVYQEIIDREKLAPAGLMARDLFALLRLQQNDFAGARTLANQVLAVSPRDEQALVVRGNIALATQEPRTAISDLRAVLRDQPTAPGVLRALARAHLANGEPDIAEETMRHAFEWNPKDQGLQLDFVRLLAELGHPEEAQALVLDLVQKSPDNLDALGAEFRISVTLKDLVTASAAAEAIVALRPKLAVGYFYQGMLADARNHPDEALRLYGKALDIQPGYADPLEGIVWLLAKQKRVPEALKRLDDVAAREPKNSAVLQIKGNVLVGEGRFTDAEAAFRQAIKRSPAWWLPYRGLAYAQLKAKEDPSVAIATLRDAETVVAQKDAIGEELASLLETLGKHDEAIAENEALERNFPRSEEIANNLALLLVTYRTDRASLDRAKELATRFAESSNASLLDTYGWVLYKRGEAAASVPVLARVVAKSPNAALARYHLGMAQSQAGDPADARDNLTRAVNSGTRFSGLDEAKATLERIAKLPNMGAPAPKS